MVLEQSEIKRVNMRVLFVASGNQKIESIAPFIAVQIDSLIAQGVDVTLFRMVGRGIKGYLRAILQLRQSLKTNQPNVIHAHYSLCGYMAWIASIGLSCKVVVSLMGSDMTRIPLIRFFAKHCWNATIVKSQEMHDTLGFPFVHVVPNGVDFSKMQLIEKDSARDICQFQKDKKYVIWCSQIEREEKNYPLAQESIAMLNDDNVVLYPVQDVPHHMINAYMRAADVLLLTSTREGSPNVIKEAMACNTPIATTNVGDVQWLLEGVEGTYIANEQSAEEVCICVKKALDFRGVVLGRERLKQIGLTTDSVALKIIDIYHTICNNQ